MTIVVDNEKGDRAPQHIMETSLYVEDLAQAREFYGRVLGLEPFAEVEGRHLFFKVGRGMLLLFNPEATTIASGEVPTHGASGPGHAALGVSLADIDRWRRRLHEFGVEIEAEVKWPSGGHSLYFRDPAGNSLELTTPETWGFKEEGVG